MCCLQCDSPYIIKFYSAFFVENRISICTEFMDGESHLFWHCQVSGRQHLHRKRSLSISTNWIELFVFDVGGSLDVYWRIPEHVLGRIAVAVSPFRSWNCCWVSISGNFEKLGDIGISKNVLKLRLLCVCVFWLCNTLLVLNCNLLPVLTPITLSLTLSHNNQRYAAV